MRRVLYIFALTGVIAPSTSWAQYPSAAEVAAKTGRPLPPFLAAMKRHDLKVVVKRRLGDGKLADAPSGLPVGLTIIAGGAKVRDYTGKTGSDGSVMLRGIPSNPEVQSAIRYRAWVDYDGVRYPFALAGVPRDGAETQFVIEEVTTDLSAISAVHSVELLVDEEALIARHIVRLYNDSDKTINLAQLPGGGLAIPCPDGAKHPELHDEKDKRLEVRGTRVFYKGALLPSVGGPTIINFVYTIPYKQSVFEWSQTLPVRVRGYSVAAPLHKLSQQRAAVILELTPREGFGRVKKIEQRPGREWVVLRSDGRTLEANEAMQFSIGNLPERNNYAEYGLLGASGLIILVVLFGFRREEGEGSARLSLGHLEAERDRLIKALARMRKAHEKGRMSDARFTREQEAITARLVSLYRAIDRLTVS